MSMATDSKRRAYAGDSKSFGVQGSVLDAGERLVDLERLGHVLPKLRAHEVLRQAAYERKVESESNVEVLSYCPWLLT